MVAAELEEAPANLIPVTVAYLRQLDRRPRPTPAREAALIAAAKHGDRVARAELIEAFVP